MDVNHKSIRCDTWRMLFPVYSSCVPVRPPSNNPTHSAGIPEDVQSSNFVVLEGATQISTTSRYGFSSSTTRNSLTS